MSEKKMSGNRKGSVVERSLGRCVEQHSEVAFRKRSLSVEA